MKINFTLEEFVTSQSYISRRDLLTFIKQGNVSVNNQPVFDLKAEINAKNDTVVINGEFIQFQFDYLYYKFFKPKGILSTMEDPNGRSCIGDYIRSLGLPLVPVGRLDRASSGLIILTNDGQLSHKLMHPSFECEKVYHVTLEKKMSKINLDRLKAGFILEDGPVVFLRVDEISDQEFVLSINEGRNRLIRRSFEHFGCYVSELKRLQIGDVDLKGLVKGDIVPLSADELYSLQH